MRAFPLYRKKPSKKRLVPDKSHLRGGEGARGEVGRGDDVLHAKARAVGGRVQVRETSQLGSLRKWRRIFGFISVLNILHAFSLFSLFFERFLNRVGSSVNKS